MEHPKTGGEQGPARILVVGRHLHIMVKVKAMLEAAGYVPLGAQTDEEALEMMRSEAPSALLVGGGVEPSSRGALVSAFHRERPGRPVIEHSGGPHGLVEHIRARLVGQV